MKDAWAEREKALENEYFHKQERELIERMRGEKRHEMIVELSKNRCPKCGDVIEPMTFRGVPLDKCVSCGGVWLGPNDLQILASKDHRTWFDLWFKAEDEAEEQS